MKNKAVFVAVVLAWAMMVSVNAYAGDANCPLTNFCAGVGGFLYNALPWNWGNWMGK